MGLFFIFYFVFQQKLNVPFKNYPSTRFKLKTPLLVWETTTVQKCSLLIGRIYNVYNVC